MLLAGALRTPAAHPLSPRSSNNNSRRIFFLSITAALLRLPRSEAPAAAAKPQATCSRPLAPLLDTEAAEGAETNEAACPAAAEARPLCHGSSGALAAAR